MTAHTLDAERRAAGNQVVHDPGHVETDPLWRAIEAKLNDYGLASWAVRQPELMNALRAAVAGMVGEGPGGAKA